jgi:hypothetical protein
MNCVQSHLAIAAALRYEYKNTMEQLMSLAATAQTQELAMANTREGL